MNKYNKQSKRKPQSKNESDSEDEGKQEEDLDNADDDSDDSEDEDEDAPSVLPYRTLKDLVRGNVLMPDPLPSQIIRNPKIPHMPAYISNVVSTYRIVGPHGEKLILKRDQIADATRTTLGFSCNYSKGGALTTHLSLDGPDHRPKLKTYRTSSTHQLADKTPEHALLTAHRYAYELSKLFGIRVYASPIKMHNVVMSLDAGRKLDPALIEQVTSGLGSTFQGGRTKSTMKQFPGVIVYSKVASPMVYLFFESGMITSCGAASREHIMMALEEINDILKKQLQLALRQNPGDMQIVTAARNLAMQENAIARANEMMTRVFHMVPRELNYKVTRHL